MSEPKPRRQALIREYREATTFEKRVAAAALQLRAALKSIRERHGATVLREAEREVFHR